MTPLISIIIPTYQHANVLPECLDAIFAQSYPNIEVIVVDDGSTDNTQEVLRSYNDRIKIIRQKNQGANPARNHGFEQATGEFVLFCDADVIMRPNMIEHLHQALVDYPDASYAYSSFWFGWKYFKGLPFDAHKLRQINYIHTASLIRRGDFPGFDNEIKRLQDWDLWLTMLATRKTGVLVPEALCTARIEGASRIGSSWLPKIVYRIPWNALGWIPKRVKKYQEARAVIAKKHGLAS